MINAVRNRLRKVLYLTLRSRSKSRFSFLLRLLAARLVLDLQIKAVSETLAKESCEIEGVRL